MNVAYRIVGGLLVLAALGGVIWFKVRPAPTPPTVNREVCEECALPPAMAGKGEPTPAIPTGSGLPCLAEFGSDECEACKKMAGILADMEPGVTGALDIVRVDTDDYPAAAQEWKLRMIPTQVGVSAEGEELWRHEGAISEAEIRAELERAGVTLPAEATPSPES